MRLERNHGEAIRLLQARLAQFHFAFRVRQGPSSGDTGFATAPCWRCDWSKGGAEQARDTLTQLYKDQPDNSFFAQMLSLANAALGDKDAALNEAKRAIMFLPSAKDRVSGPTREEVLALIQMILGET